MASPQPKPTPLKILAGNPGKRPLPKDEPKLKVARPRIPAGLGKHGRAEWKRIVPLLMQMRVLTLKDRSALQAYCESWQEFIEARDHVRKHGQVYQSEQVNGALVWKRNPASQVMVEQSRLLLAYMQSFGLTPSSQSKVASIKDDKAKAKDLW